MSSDQWPNEPTKISKTPATKSKVQCPECGAMLVVEDFKLASGKKLKCAKCTTVFQSTQALVSVSESRRCPYCCEDIQVNAKKCKHCGEIVDPVVRDDRFKPKVYEPVAPKPHKGKAAALAFFLGGLGAHKFYLGKPLWGCIYILGCVTFIPQVVGMIEGIAYLCMTDEEFERRYAP